MARATSIVSVNGADPDEVIAETVKVWVPAVVGVPDSTPCCDSDSPGGNAPPVTMTSGAGVPATWYAYGPYTVPTIPSGANPITDGGVLGVTFSANAWRPPAAIVVTPDLAASGTATSCGKE